MGYRLCEIVTESEFCQELSVEAISCVLPRETSVPALEVEGLHAIVGRDL